MTPKTVSVVTNAVHVFVVRRDKLQLRLRFQALDGSPMSSANCEVVGGHVAGASAKTSRSKAAGRDGPPTTDAAGLVVIDIPVDASTIDVALAGQEWSLRIGLLDPADEPSGPWARLINLGYLDSDEAPKTDPPTTPDDRALRWARCAAVETFQRDHGLPKTGELDAVTIAKLREVHGC